jgi:5-methylcytosine-specific restriction enzyme subunit McrC
VINLFEYQNKVEAPENFEKLDKFLDGVWKNRDTSGYYFDESETGKYQKFIKYLYKNKHIKSNKYVGVIRFEDQKINLLPKIFYDRDINYNDLDDEDPNLNAIHNHILWWLSYCRKIKFPNYQTALGNQKNDFFEVLIYLFSKYTRELLSSSIYQQYEEINKELSFIKGRLNINAYINENLSRGNWHKLNCTYDAFVFDNKFNRIIKHVTTMLFRASASPDNKRNLREILFILDEVSEECATAEECAAISFNPVFEQFATVRDYCYLFLNNSISFDYKNDLKLFAFLLPMEYVFEDFIFGFIEKEIEEIKAKPQAGSKYLDSGRNFALRPDLILLSQSNKFIADTKYKIVYSDDKNAKNGISQTDLYQMLAYAVRFNIDQIFLFYPNTLKDTCEQSGEINIKDKLADNREISIKSSRLPIINHSLFEKDDKEDDKKDAKLNDIFEETKKQLIKKIKDILRLT